MFRNRTYALLLCCLVFLAIGGCGYHFRDQTLNLPPNIKSLAIPIFENQTHEIGFESVMTNELSREFNRRQKLQVKSSTVADSILKGKISSIYFSAVSFGADEKATERRVTVSVDVRLLDSHSGKTLWQRNGLSYLEAYVVNQTDPIRTEFNKRAALTRIAENLTEKIHDYLYSGF